MRLLPCLLVLLAATPYQYFFTGSAKDIGTKPNAAFALIGGGEDVDEISRWFAGKANGGDLLILRASSTDEYNSYFFKLAPLNSVQTLVVASADAARDPFVAGKISHAEAIFLAGGDQWNYVRLWNQSPMGDALRAAVKRGLPVAGTSAGLAVLGEYIFSAEHDTVTSPEALVDPYDKRVTLVHNFLGISALHNTITDSHFKVRNRMGRTLGFLARMLEDFHLDEARAIAIDERTAALLEPSGKLSVAGLGHVYFLRARQRAQVCRQHVPLAISEVEVHRSGPGEHFDTSTWTSAGGTAYKLSVSAGVITSTQPNHSIY